MHPHRHPLAIDPGLRNGEQIHQPHMLVLRFCRALVLAVGSEHDPFEQS
jgi:hypothetical protein